MTSTIFIEFNPSNKEAWKNQAIRDLRGKDFDQSLKSILWDKIEIEPFYTREDLNGLPRLPEISLENDPPIPDFPPRNWVNLVAVFPDTPNRDILHSLQNGATGLILHLKGDENLDEILKGVLPEYIDLLIKPLGDPVLVLEAFQEWVRKSGKGPSQVKGSLLWSPMDLLFDSGNGWQEALLTLKKLIALGEDLPAFHPFSIQFGRYTDSGATGLQELVFGFGELIELIGRSGIDPEVFFRKVTFYSSVSASHFAEIAKLKAMRIFAAELAFQYGVILEPDQLIIYANTSDWSKSILDSNNNLIRQTYEAMAAVFGGVNGLWVKPFQEGFGGELEQRIARNVTSILVHESYLDKVSDPSAGSFYLDKLTFQIMAQVRAGLQELEGNGGWLAAFETREIHRKVRENRLKQQHEVLSGKVSKIGVNKYPPTERLRNSLKCSVILEKDFELKPSRESYLVELQNQTEA